MGVELWVSTRSVAGAGDEVRIFEDEGWDGLTFTESQNRAGDPYVAMATAAAYTSRIRLGTGVTNPITRHPAVTAAAIASVHLESGGRATLGIGRGDTALAHLGLAPAPVAELRAYLETVQTYLRGGAVPLSRSAGPRGVTVGRLPLADRPVASRMPWPVRAGLAKVPVFVAASGPQVLRMAAQLGDRVAIAVGADPRRVAWAVRTIRSVRADVPISAYVNVVVDEDAERAGRLAAGRILTFARFSAMHGGVRGPHPDGDRDVLERLVRDFPMSRHGYDGAHADALTPGFLRRFAVLGPAPYCVDRLLELVELGVDRLHVIGAHPEHAREVRHRFVAQVMDPLRDQTREQACLTP